MAIPNKFVQPSVYVTLGEVLLWQIWLTLFMPDSIQRGAMMAIKLQMHPLLVLVSAFALTPLS